MVKLNQLAFQ